MLGDWLLLSWLPILLLIVLARLAWRRWRWVGLVGLTLLMTLVAIDLVLFEASVDVWLWSRDWTRIKDAPWQTLAALIAAFVAIITLYVSTRQKEDEAERKARRDEYGDILDRFADEKNALLRANAALRLAVIARQAFPGPSGRLEADRYPLFSNACAQLAAALTIEREPAVRAAVLTALKQLGEFAKNGYHDLWLTPIKEVYHANRNALDSFITSFARYAALISSDLSDDQLRALVGFTPLCPSDDGQTLSILRSLMADHRFRGAIAPQRRLWEARLPTDAAERAKFHLEEEARRLNTVTEAAGQLADTRTALATLLSQPYQAPLVARCLNNLVRALHISKPPSEGGRYLWREVTLRKTALDWETEFDGAFLAGAELRNARLYAVEMPEVWLQGAYLYGADLRNALLDQAQLQGARLDRVQLQNASLNRAQLQGATVRAAYFASAKFGIEEQSLTDLTGVSWRDADFKDPLTGQRDDSLYNQLAARWPRPDQQPVQSAANSASPTAGQYTDTSPDDKVSSPGQDEPTIVRPDDTTTSGGTCDA